MVGRAVFRRFGGLVFSLALAAMPALSGSSVPAFAHDKETHGAKAAETPPPALPDSITVSGLPFDLDIGAGFTGLVDAEGTEKSLSDFRGRHLLVFFGYANCEAICSAALPDMARMVDFIDDKADSVLPVMITVDPDRDQPEVMGAALTKVDPRLYGLTGTPEALAATRKAFQVETEIVGTDWFGKPIFSHGSFLYLIGPDGALETLLPPVLGPEHMAKIVKKYL